MMTRWAVVAALVLAGCSGGGSLDLSEAFCNDLEAGITPFQIYGGSIKDRYPTPKDFADFAYGAAAVDCPDQLKTNEALRTFLEGWDIDPDA